MDDRPHVNKAEPVIFSVSTDVELVLTGANLDQPTLWLQLRDIALAATDTKKSFKATFQSPDTAKFFIPKNSINVTATKYQIMLAKCAPETEPHPVDWQSHKASPKVILFDVSSLVRATIPTEGNETCSIGLYNTPDEVEKATITLTSRDLSKYTGKPAQPVTLTVNGWVQVANFASDSREGQVHFVTPILPSEGTFFQLSSLNTILIHIVGLYDVTFSLSLKEPHSTSPTVTVPGPPLIAYQPVFGSTTSIDKPTIPAIAINCSFSEKPLSPGSQFHQASFFLLFKLDSQLLTEHPPIISKLVESIQ